MNKKSLAALVILVSLAGLLGFACGEKDPAPAADSSTISTGEALPETQAAPISENLDRQEDKSNVSDSSTAKKSYTEEKSNDD